MPGRNRGGPVHKAINVNLLFSLSGAAKSVGSRNTQHGFSPSSEETKMSNPKPDQRVFHETRDTKHESRLFFETRPFPTFLLERTKSPAHGFHESRKTACKVFHYPRPFPWLVWYRLVLKPFSLVFSAGIWFRLRVMTPLLGTKTSSTPVGDAPAGDDKAAQATSFQVFTRPETRDKAIAWREAQASANSEVFTKHETRDPKHGLFRGSFGTGWY